MCYILYRSGIDIKAIQELLGHTKVEITEIYTHLYDWETIIENTTAKFNIKDIQPVTLNLLNGQVDIIY